MDDKLKDINVSEAPKQKGIFSRIVAIILLLGLIVVFGGFIYSIIIGKYIIQMLFIVIMYPLLIYLFIWVKKVYSRKED